MSFTPPSQSFDAARLRAALLDWYDRQGRTLPWRLRPEDRAAGAVADPYAIWLSEIMLQQTTVVHATPYWEAFLGRWPSVHDLARAPREDVLAAWAGLGYYARARNLHACAGVVSQELNGQFPSELDQLSKLPGIGEYTSNAIRAVAFDKPASVVDGNVERVLARLASIEVPLPKAKPVIKSLAAELADPVRPGDYAQAIMDLGATVCTPKSPSCPSCPWRASCTSYSAGTQIRYPLKEKKKPKPVRRGLCFHVVRDGCLWLRRRPDTGLLGGMLELPGPEWSERAQAPQPGDATPFDASWAHAGQVRHVFTHFSLELDVYSAEAPGDWQPETGQFIALRDLETAGLPSVMMKAAKLALGPRLV